LNLEGTLERGGRESAKRTGSKILRNNKTAHGTRRRQRIRGQREKRLSEIDGDDGTKVLRFTRETEERRKKKTDDGGSEKGARDRHLGLVQVRTGLRNTAKRYPVESPQGNPLPDLAKD